MPSAYFRDAAVGPDRGLGARRIRLNRSADPCRSQRGDGDTTFTPHPRPEPTIVREGRCRKLTRVIRHASLVGVLRPLRLLVQRLEHPVAEEAVVDELDAGVRDSGYARDLVEVAAALVLLAPGRFHPLRIVGEVVWAAVLQRRDRALARSEARLQRLRDARTRRRLARAQRVTGEQHPRPPRRPRGEAHRQPPGPHALVLLQLFDRRQLPLTWQRPQELAKELCGVDGLPVLVAVDVAEADVEPPVAHREHPAVAR